jgi:beta-glucanase (GH16 family)
MLRYLFILFFYYLFISCSEGQETGQEPSGKLIWSDEFDYTGLPDASKWDYEKGFVRGKEAQYYTVRRPENAFVENGNLVITAVKERFKNPAYKPGSPNWQENREYAEYTSASVVTNGKFETKYGRIEVRAKLPYGNGTWPAIWMLGTNISQIGWPRCGEIDIMEFLGKEPNRIYGTCHWGDAEGKHKSEGTHIDVTPEPSKDFHIYAINWYPDRIEFFYDEQLYFTFNTDAADNGDDNAFRKPYYLLLNLALGGWGGEIDDSMGPWKYYIDYVRVYSFE